MNDFLEINRKLLLEWYAEKYFDYDSDSNEERVKQLILCSVSKNRWDMQLFETILDFLNGMLSTHMTSQVTTKRNVCNG